MGLGIAKIDIGAYIQFNVSGGALMSNFQRESEKRVDELLGEGKSWSGVIYSCLIILLIVSWTP